MTCRCAICGRKCAGRIVRKQYWQAGIRHNEDGIGKGMKVSERRILRKREKLQWKAELGSLI